MMPAVVADDTEVRRIGAELNDSTQPLKKRFRALFTLKNIGGEAALAEIQRCFSDASALLKHELAYCLGQMADERAVDFLEEILCKDDQEVIVRHEAAEALGAIGCESSLPLLRKFKTHPESAISETANLAVERIMLKKGGELVPDERFPSIDPAPPLETSNSVEELKSILLNESEPLFNRYRAMFSLRNRADDAAALALASGLNCGGALFRHEIGFVLGQMATPAAVDALASALADTSQSSMVRHECAEALGSIATSECFDILRSHLTDAVDVVRESCEVALDMCEYETSEQFQYADALCH